MKKTLAFALPLLLAAAPAAAQTDASGSSDMMEGAKTVEMKGADGGSMGTVSFIPTPQGVILDANLSNVPEGTHGFHIHETGLCEGDFSSAGGHYNPTDKDHGFLAENGPHAGDLPNISSANGTVRAADFTPLVTMTGGDAPLDDDDGSALIIHSGADDYMSQPSGDAGDRVACGVIFPPES
ncbi:superoxide dismutase family protein [Jiella marina]|uniref:superoxide dismutase family protein n=1 Tax=Jiella sp. LLJ827 TaxID=2917712 RepID=UPI002100D00C|nr:superoxide dismutase family protein [Jiella sp. LLJ827]MCQ0989100.1 superoxide dismutase family protein [Jiella sp. LLJ827]